MRAMAWGWGAACTLVLCLQHVACFAPPAPVLLQRLWAAHRENCVGAARIPVPQSGPRRRFAAMLPVWPPRFRSATLRYAMAEDGAGQGSEEELSRFILGGIELREAEAHFVDEEENLEEGEKLVRAIKAFDSRNNVLLCAGALVRSTHNENYGTSLDDQWDQSLQALIGGQSAPGEAGTTGGRGEDGELVFHDLWLSDSIESGVGPKLQIKGALAVLDCPC